MIIFHVNGVCVKDTVQKWNHRTDQKHEAGFPPVFMCLSCATCTGVTQLPENFPQTTVLIIVHWITKDWTLVGTLEQLGCWLTPACQAWQAAKFLHHFVVHPLVSKLSVEQKHGLDVPSVDTGGQSFMLLLAHWITEVFALISFLKCSMLLLPSWDQKRCLLLFLRKQMVSAIVKKEHPRCCNWGVVMIVPSDATKSHVTCKNTQICDGTCTLHCNLETHKMLVCAKCQLWQQTQSAKKNTFQRMKVFLQIGDIAESIIDPHMPDHWNWTACFKHMDVVTRHLQSASHGRAHLMPKIELVCLHSLEHDLSETWTWQNCSFLTFVARVKPKQGALKVNADFCMHFCFFTKIVHCCAKQCATLFQHILIHIKWMGATSIYFQVMLEDTTECLSWCKMGKWHDKRWEPGCAGSNFQFSSFFLLMQNAHDSEAFIVIGGVNSTVIKVPVRVGCVLLYS